MSQEDVVVSAAGGPVTLNVTVTNPVEGAVVRANSDADWISDYTADATKVSFNVAPNTSTEARETVLNITYQYGTVEDVSTTSAVIRQEGVETPEEEYPDAFEFTVSNVDITTADIRVACNYDDLRWTAGVFSEEEIETIVGGRDALLSYLTSSFEYNSQTYGSMQEYLDAILNEGSEVYQGTIEDLTPATSYVVYAVGMDLNCNFLTVVYWSETFTTLEEPVIDPEDGPYATASIDTYWDVDDVIEYNPDYEFYSYDGPYLAAISIEFNDLAAGAYYATLGGDRTIDWTPEDLRQYAFDAGRRVVPGSPLQLRSIDNEEGLLTIVVVAYDEAGNYGVEFIDCLQIEGEPSQDMEYFEEVRNAYLGL